MAQPVLAGDYQQSPQVAEFVGEMTRDYGFAGEQLTSMFAEVERKQAILDAISRPAEKASRGRITGRSLSPTSASARVWSSGSSTKRRWPAPKPNTACRRR